MSTAQNLILDHKQTLKKIKRIAFEVYEQNFDESALVIAGIYDSGYEFARLLQAELDKIAPIKTQLVKVSLNKATPTQSEVHLDCDPNALASLPVVLADDVLNTGRTLAYSLQPFLQIPLKKLQVAVLVDRNYRKFPIAADYIGYSLSTTIKEQVKVTLDAEKGFGVSLH